MPTPAGVQTNFEDGEILTAEDLNASFGLALPVSSVGQPSGVASLGSDGKVPVSMLPPAAAGLSIVSTAMVSGDLVITYSDNSTVDVGHVLGAPGSPGAAGVSIVGAAVNTSGRLILTFSDSSQKDAGSVIGPPGATGRSVTGGTVNSSGHLVLSFSDGTQSDAGNVQGPPGSTPLTVTLDQLSTAATLSDTDVLAIVQPSQATGSQMLKLTWASLKAGLITAGFQSGSGAGVGSGAPALPSLTGVAAIARFSAKAPGSNAATWNDIGGNGWNLTSVSSNPVMTVDGSSRPVCRFNGTSDAWRMPAALYTALAGPANAAGDHAVSAYVVFNNTNGAAGGNIFYISDSAGSNYWRQYIDVSLGWASVAGSNFGGSNNYDLVTENLAPANGTKSSVTCKNLKTTSGFADVIIGLWISGTDKSNAGANNTHSGIVEIPTLTQGYIGSSASGSYCKGDLYEIIFFTGAPTSTDVAALHQWAQTNFGAP